MSCAKCSTALRHETNVHIQCAGCEDRFHPKCLSPGDLNDFFTATRERHYWYCRGCNEDSDSIKNELKGLWCGGPLPFLSNAREDRESREQKERMQELERVHKKEEKELKKQRERMEKKIKKEEKERLKKRKYKNQDAAQALEVLEYAVNAFGGRESLIDKNRGRKVEDKKEEEKKNEEDGAKKEGPKMEADDTEGMADRFALL